MEIQPVARLGDTGSHGGIITTGSETIFVNDKPLARAGDIYQCPEHGGNSIIDGVTGIWGESERIAYVGSRTACGATITSGSPDTFVGIQLLPNHSQYLSDILAEKSFIDFQLVDELDTPIAGEAFILSLPDGTKITGNLDNNGCIHIDNIPRGTCHISFPGLNETGTIE